MTLALKQQFSDEKTLPKQKMTYEEFLDWADEDTYAEWVDGEVEWMSPASARHQDIKIFLVRLLADYNEVHSMGIVLDAPFQMRLTTVRRGREPDILFIANEHRDRLRPNYLDGPADLVIEIISPESIERDRVQKFREYESSGVREYWLLDPVNEQAEFYELNDISRYTPHLSNTVGVYESAVLPGFWINTNWLWQSPLPTLRQVWKQWENNTQ